MTLTNSIQRIKIGDLPAFEIRHGKAKAIILEQGAHLVSYGIEGEIPVIWDNPNAVFEKGVAVRGGIPVCWPWFGDIAWNSKQIQSMCSGFDTPPFHGLVRNVDWQVESLHVMDGGTCITFQYETTPDQATCWQHQARLQLSFTIGQSLTLELKTKNLGNEDIVVGQALHTYYAVSDAEMVSFEGLSGVEYFDVLDGWKKKMQHEEPVITDETTRAYIQAPNRLTIEDQGWNRRITVSTQGTRSAILWNPWKERSLLLDQYQGDSWKNMVCLETARFGDDLVLIAPGETDTMTLNIAVQESP